MNRTPRPPAGRRPAFTLVELLVVITIIGLLVAILLPALGAVLRYADNLQCQSNLRQIASAVLSYTTDYRGAIPPTKLEPSGLYWCNILAAKYIPAQNAAKLPDNEISTQSTVLLCPTATDARTLEADAFTRPDHVKAQGWYRLGNNDTKVDCSYYWNGYTGTDATMRGRVPSLRVDESGPNPALSIHNLAEVAQRSNLAMVMDGVFYDGVLKPQRIAARHPGLYGERLLTNVAYYDGHVEALDRYAPGRYPNRDWAQEVPAEQRDAEPDQWEWQPVMRREPPLEGGPPFFLLPKR